MRPASHPSERDSPSLLRKAEFDDIKGLVAPKSRKMLRARAKARLFESRLPLYGVGRISVSKDCMAFLGETNTPDRRTDTTDPNRVRHMILCPSSCLARWQV